MLTSVLIQGGSTGQSKDETSNPSGPGPLVPGARLQAAAPKTCQINPIVLGDLLQTVHDGPGTSRKPRRGSSILDAPAQVGLGTEQVLHNTPPAFKKTLDVFAYHGTAAAGDASRGTYTTDHLSRHNQTTNDTLKPGAVGG